MNPHEVSNLINAELTARGSNVKCSYIATVLTQEDMSSGFCGMLNTKNLLKVELNGLYDSYHTVFLHILQHFKLTIQSMVEFHYMDTEGLRSWVRFNNGRVEARPTDPCESQRFGFNGPKVITGMFVEETLSDTVNRGFFLV